MCFFQFFIRTATQIRILNIFWSHWVFCRIFLFNQDFDLLNEVVVRMCGLTHRFFNCLVFLQVNDFVKINFLQIII